MALLKRKKERESILFSVMLLFVSYIKNCLTNYKPKYLKIFEIIEQFFPFEIFLQIFADKSFETLHSMIYLKTV